MSAADPGRGARKGSSLPTPGRLTPMFKQWLESKRQHPDALLFFRMGDFYELFFDDAKTAAPIMEVALTARGKNTETEAPMCGVPHHAMRQYVSRLVEKGYRVAICEQMEDPKKTKGMVRREVVRVVSPGTLIDPEDLDPGVSNWLASVTRRESGVFGIALIDLSTGSLILAEAADDEGLADLLARYEAREVLLADDAALESTAAALPDVRGQRPLVTEIDAGLFHPMLANERVLEGLAVRSLSGFGCPEDHPALPAAAAALGHLGETQRVRPRHLDRLHVEAPERVMTLDATTRRNLEIVANLRDATRRNTLLSVVDRTQTPMGSRRVRTWLLEPLRDVGEITQRQQVVATLLEGTLQRRDLRSALGEIRDLERLLGRAALRASTPNDLATLRRSLASLPAAREALQRCDASRAHGLAERIDPLEDLHGLLESALADEPGAQPGEGRVIREGHDAALDEARELSRGGKTLIAGIESRERERTGISSLKIKYNRVFGYFIEVSKSNISRVPDDYERRQTLATGERYVTEEIKELEGRILSAEERVGERERELFAALVDAVVERAARLRETADAVAEADVLAGFAESAASLGYVRPLVDDQDRIEIENGRHPVVESLLSSGSFVPNDCSLDEERRLLIVTGPNMGGKSTFLRQVALIVVLAQAGAFVPASAARIGVCDRVFCRVGASDNLAEGESTFMVEMTETANILHNATPRSLVILDEIGRGTATWDGMALAWSVVEHLHEDARLRPRALFATHYHELTELAAQLPRLANVHISVREHGHDIVFLHRVEEGPSDRSYGIHVARLAGIPTRVIERARQILERLSEQGSPPATLVREERPSPQLSLFESTPALDPAEREALEALRAADVDGLTPREAHALLADLIDKLRES